MLDGSMLLYSDQREGGHRFPMGHGSLGGRMQRRRYEKACGSPHHGRLLPDPRAPAFSVTSPQTSALSRSTSDNSSESTAGQGQDQYHHAAHVSRDGHRRKTQAGARG